MHRAWAAAVSSIPCVLLAGCSYDTAFAPGTQASAAASSTASTGGAGGGATAGSASGGAGTAGAGGARGACIDGHLAFVDAFSDGTLDPAWLWSAQGNGQIEEIGGVLRFSIPATSSGVVESRIASAAAYPLQDCAAFFRLVTPPDVANETGVFFYITSRGGVFFGISIYEKILSAGSFGGGEFTTAFDPNVHTWWMIREAAGHVIIEVASDGLSWTPVFDTATELSEPVTIGIGFGNNGFDPKPVGPDSAVIDNFNVPPS